MRHQEATAMIGAPVRAIEEALTDVVSWSTFLIGVDTVEKLGHERYRFRIVDGRDRREQTMCVRHWPDNHVFTWRSLDGPTYAGRLELRATNADHTVVRLGLTSHPGTLVAGLAEMVLPRMSRAAHDLRNLEERVLAAR